MTFCDYLHAEWEEDGKDDESEGEVQNWLHWGTAGTDPGDEVYHGETQHVGPASILLRRQCEESARGTASLPCLYRFQITEE